MLAWRKMAHYRRTGRSIAHSEEPRDPASSAQSRLSLRDLIRIQDFMAVLMVIATAFTGYATWRYVEVSRDIFGAAERPYVGVQGIRIDQSAPRQPHLIVEYRDFGNIPADQTIIIGQLTINGQLVPGQRKASAELGVLSPQVAHFWHRAIPPESLRPILDGKSVLSVGIEFAYRDANDRHYCYRMAFEYHPNVNDFTPAGGSDRCSTQKP